ncbi:NADH-ubiquinone oxidoreductase subunit 10 domain-containing protein [Ditylenchus destructor]|nr:NADH-ubiquinone oxidoreductase subunit 10 domain-containing protein [Ditylenchus destructor]
MFGKTEASGKEELKSEKPKESEDPIKNRDAIKKFRELEKKEWEAYWFVRRLDVQDTWLLKFRYWQQRFIDAPATWFRQNIVEPLHDRNAKPYYQHQFDRAPEIDQCGVNDRACFYEANEQFRRDKVVDWQILEILNERVNRCMTYNWKNERGPPLGPIHLCTQAIEDYEIAELNFFIKYGELGSAVTTIDCYMKQKHRMIWERRHPEVMAERERAYQKYLEKKKNGYFDMSFWKKGLTFQDKKKHQPPYDLRTDKSPYDKDQPLSKDWRFYKQAAQDPEFAKEQNKIAKPLEPPESRIKKILETRRQHKENNP